MIKSNNLTKYEDHRGFFVELFKGENNWKQMNCSCSKKNVIRGLHVTNFNKYVLCIKGKILDVVVNLQDKTVETFILEDCNQSVFVPAGYAHGFQSLEEDSVVVYFQSGEYNPKEEWIVPWNAFEIPWIGKDFILSEKDRNCSGYLP